MGFKVDVGRSRVSKGGHDWRTPTMLKYGNIFEGPTAIDNTKM
jgi:hypothetical protein